MGWNRIGIGPAIAVGTTGDVKGYEPGNNYGNIECPHRTFQRYHWAHKT